MHRETDATRNPARLPAGLAALLLAALLLATPLSAAMQGSALGGEAGSGEKEVEKDGKDVKVHRVVLAPGEEGVRIVNLPEGTAGEADRQVRVVVRTAADGEAEGETWVWNSEDGETFEVGPDAKVFFATRVPRAYLGVQLTDLSPELRAHFGSLEDRGVLVGKVMPDSPAARAGLKVGDLLTHIDGQPVESSFDVTTRVGSRKDGEVVALEVIRNGKVETLSATLEVRQRPQIDVGDFLHKFRVGEGQDWAFHVGEGATWEFDSEALEKKLEGVRTFLDSEEWRQEMEQMEVELRKELENMEVEMEELERHLRELDIDVDFDSDVDSDEEEVEVGPETP